MFMGLGVGHLGDAYHTGKTLGGSPKTPGKSVPPPRLGLTLFQSPQKFPVLDAAEAGDMAQQAVKELLLFESSVLFGQEAIQREIPDHGREFPSS